MKAEDVMKALECCANTGCCEGCPFDKPSHACLIDLPKSALALLREKDALIEALAKNNADLEEELAETHDLCEEKDAELARLKGEIK